MRCCKGSIDSLACHRITDLPPPQQLCQLELWALSTGGLSPELSCTWWNCLNFGGMAEKSLQGSLLGCVSPGGSQGKGGSPTRLTALALTGCKQAKGLSLECGALPWPCLGAFAPKLGYKHHPLLAEELQCPPNPVPVPSRSGAMIWKKGVTTRSQNWELLSSLTAVIQCHCCP